MPIRVKPSRRWARRWYLKRASPGSHTLSISSSRCRRTKLSCKLAFSTSVRRSRSSTAPQLPRSTRAAIKSLGGILGSFRPRISEHLSIGCGRTRLKAGPDRRAQRSMPCFGLTPWTSSTARWKATRRWASPICRISHRKRGGEMANEKVDVVIVGAGASGSVYASVLAKAGKKVVLLEAGPDWDLSDLISSEIWGRRIKPAGAPILLEGKNPMAYAAQGGWGVGGAALHYYANFPRLLPTDFRIKSEHNRAHDWPISYQEVAPFYDKVAREIGVSGDARAEEKWRPAGEAYPMPPMKTFRNGNIWLKGFEASGIPMVPAPVGMNSVEFKGRPACLYDGWCHVGCPIGALANPQVTYLGDARKAGAELRAFSTVTRVLTNQAGTRVTGVEYYDDKHQKQIQEASVVLLAAWSAQNPRLLLNSATDKH